MEHDMQSPGRRHRRRLAGGIGLVAVGLVAGGIAASSLTASAASGTASPTASTSTAAPQRRGPGGAAPVRSDEKQLTGTDAAKATAAARKAVPGGTVYRVETDAGDGTYEAHMTKADGTQVTVKLDKNFAVTAVESGMGKGDPQLAGHGGGN
jgi:hypothetical protein